MATMVSSVWRGSRTVLVAVVGPHFPAEEDWVTYMALGREILAAAAPGETAYSLSFSDGGGPTSSQRKAVVQMIGGRTIRGALVTTSRLARGIGSIFSWIQPEFRVFAPQDTRRALLHIGVPRDEWASLLAAVRQADAGMHLRCLGEVPADLWAPGS